MRSEYYCEHSLVPAVRCLCSSCFVHFVASLSEHSTVRFLSVELTVQHAVAGAGSQKHPAHLIRALTLAVVLRTYAVPRAVGAFVGASRRVLAAAGFAIDSLALLRQGAATRSPSFLGLPG